MKTKASIDTYLEQLLSGKLKSNTARVFTEIQSKISIDTDTLRDALAMKHQTLTSSLSALCDLGVIVVIGQLRRNGNSYSIYKYVSEISDRSNNRQHRSNLKFTNLLKRLFDEFSSMVSDDMTIEDLKKYVSAKEYKVCTVEWEYNGVTYIKTFETTEPEMEDAWSGLDLDNLAFDINVYEDEEGFKSSVYRLTKRDEMGRWLADDWVSINNSTLIIK